jgi:hypothetical protein
LKVEGSGGGVELALARAAAEEGVFLMADIMVKKSC